MDLWDGTVMGQTESVMEKLVVKKFIARAGAIAVCAALLPGIAHARDRERITVDVFALLNEASGETSDGFEDQDASGFIIGGDTEFEIRRDDHRFRLGAGSTYYAYSEEDRDDRHNNAVWLTYSTPLSGRLSVWVQGKHDTNMSALEARETRQDRIRSQLIWQEGDNRIRARAGYRWREYISDDTDGDGLELGADYRRRFDNGMSSYTYVRWDEIEADVLRRSYERWTLGTDLTVPVSDRIDIIPSLRYRTWSYPSRLVDGLELREDSSLNPRISVVYDLGDDWEVLGRAGVIWRRSNDDRFDETITRLSIGVSKRLRWDL